MNEELWKVIPFESNYEVSTHGRIRNVSTMQIKSQRLDRYGYRRVTLYPSGKTHTIHRLVAGVWLPPKEEGLQVNHKDFDKTNNQLDNLEWCSVKDNCVHRETFLDPERISGENNPMARYTSRQVLDIRAEHSTGVSYLEIARRMGVPPEPIRRIVNRESWKNI